ncbi:hypothetical protein [Neokomagataea tanensis]|nr:MULTISPECIES: hypothetical protein [Neokomagataea]
MSVPLGVWLLARGRGVGINCFGPGVQPLMGALAPTIAMAIIAVGLTFQTSKVGWGMGLVRALVPLTSTLLQLVVTHICARRIKREGLWLRYSTASLWCAWLPIILVFLLEGFLTATVPAEHLNSSLTIGMMVVVQFYSLWLSWYVSKVGLLVTSLQAAMVVVAQVAALAVLLGVLYLLPPHYNAMLDMISVS